MQGSDYANALNRRQTAITPPRNGYEAAMTIDPEWLCERFEEQCRRIGIAAALCESADLDDPHRAIERDRDDVAAAHLMTWRANLAPVDPHMACGGKTRRGGSGSHDACMP